MPRARSLHLVPVQYDISLKNGDVVATCTRYGTGSWCIRDIEAGWVEDVAGPLDLQQLLPKYEELRRIKRSVKLAKLAVQREAKKRK